MTKLDLVCYNKRNFIFASESSGLDENQISAKRIDKALEIQIFYQTRGCSFKS